MCRSAPSAVGTAGAGFGVEMGFEATDSIFVLNDSIAVLYFAQMGSEGGKSSLSVSEGPTEDTDELVTTLSHADGLPSILTYHKANGWLVGTTFDASVLTERRGHNEKIYGAEVTARDILSGVVDVPEAADRFMRALPSAVREHVEPYTD